MGRRAHAIPPVKCRGHSKRTGLPCGRWAIPGMLICRHHGGSTPQAERAANVRTTLAELLAADPRDPRVALLDAVHAADAIFKHDKMRVLAGESLSPEEIDRFTQSFSRVATLARVAIDGKLVDTITRELEQQGALLGSVLAKALDSALGLLDLDAGRVEAVREYALATAKSELLQLDGKPAETPQPPDFETLTWATVEDPAEPAAGGPESPRTGSPAGGEGEDIVDAEIVPDGGESVEDVLAEIAQLRTELIELGVDPDSVEV